MIKSVDFKDANPTLAATDEENLDGSTNSDMAVAGANPDVELEADANGRVAGQKRVRVAPAPTPPPRKPNFWERLFGARPKPPPPTPPPVRRPAPRR
jgi:hypothetical protein